MIFEGISVEPLIHKNRALPDYYISKCGKILSFKQTKATGIPKWHKVNKKQQSIIRKEDLIPNMLDLNVLI